MRAPPVTLSAEEIRAFDDDGYVVVRGAFAREDALAMQDEWWAELAETHGILREDRTTWRQIRGDLKRPKKSPLQTRMATDRVRRVIDDLLGAGAWSLPRDWGRPIATFPQPGAWALPTELWHWDSPCGWHRDGLKALFVVSFIGAVAPRGGGTLVLSGSPRLLAQDDARSRREARWSGAAVDRERFHRTHPWLMALTGKAASPADRIDAFMARGTEVDGVQVRVVELTGEPGDMVFCHPAMIHCISPNRGTEPRFMRIKQQLLTHAGAALVNQAMHPR